jgi:hypothetical protein
MSHNTLGNYYKSVYNFTVKARFCTLTEFENLIPYERDVYFAIFEAAIEEEATNKIAAQTSDMEAYYKAIKGT